MLVQSCSCCQGCGSSATKFRAWPSTTDAKKPAAESAEMPCGQVLDQGYDSGLAAFKTSGRVAAPVHEVGQPCADAVECVTICLTIRFLSGCRNSMRNPAERWRACTFAAGPGLALESDSAQGVKQCC